MASARSIAVVRWYSVGRYQWHGHRGASGRPFGHRPRVEDGGVTSDPIIAVGGLSYYVGFDSEADNGSE